MLFFSHTRSCVCICVCELFAHVPACAGKEEQTCVKSLTAESWWQLEVTRFSTLRKKNQINFSCECEFMTLAEPGMGTHSEREAR